MTARSTAERIRDAIDQLEHRVDVWVATCSRDSQPHLVPLSLAWDGKQVIVTTPASTATARNVSQTPTARLAVGDSRDVVMLDVAVTSIPLEDADEAIVAAYASRTGWDPRGEEGSWVILCMRPTRVQVWRDVPEIKGRTVMTNGSWIE